VRTRMGVQVPAQGDVLADQWLMTSEEVRRCKGPNCSKIITFEPGEPYTGPGLERNMRGKHKTRVDKEFYSTNCRVKWRYHKVIKPCKESEGARSCAVAEYKCQRQRQQ
jgi:hypothetical protein